MRLNGITEDELEEILFVDFPADMPMAECRDSLELMISEAWEEYHSDRGWRDDEMEEMSISPFWVQMARAVMARRDLARMTRGERDAMLAEWRRTRRGGGV